MKLTDSMGDFLTHLQDLKGAIRDLKSITSCY